MILQSNLSLSTPHYLSSPLSSSYPNGSLSFVSFPYNFNVSIRCSISQIHSNGNEAMGNDKKRFQKWNYVFKKLSNIQVEAEDTQIGVSTLLDSCENEGKRLSKWDLSRLVKELRKFKKYDIALKVYEWMNNRIERFTLSSSDTAIQLDLIAKVGGIPDAEDYFTRVPDTVKDKRVYGSLLNVYVRAKIRDKAETLMDQMRNKGYALHPLPYNGMMTLYMKLGEFEKAEELVSEMKQKGIPLDSYTYNIWMSACGSRRSAEAMEQVLEQMEADPNIIPDWSTFSTMAAMYVNLGSLEKAEQSLKNLEIRIVGRDRRAYHFLISLYGSLGNREEVYRVWNIYKSLFPSIPNWGYHSVISALVRSSDIGGAEELFEEWVTVKSSYDPKIPNLLMRCYVKEEPFEKVNDFFNRMIKDGGKPNASSWEILGEGHIKEGRIPEALDCFKQAVLADGAPSLKPKHYNVKAFLDLCDQEANQASKEEFLTLLTQMDYIHDEEIESKEPKNDEIEREDTEMLLSVIE